MRGETCCAVGLFDRAVICAIEPDERAVEAVLHFTETLQKSCDTARPTVMLEKDFALRHRRRPESGGDSSLLAPHFFRSTDKAKRPPSGSRQKAVGYRRR
jgi:hypothetical protein